MQLFTNDIYNQTMLDALIHKINCPACTTGRLFTRIGGYTGAYVSCHLCPFVIRFCSDKDNLYRVSEIEYYKHVFRPLNGQWRHKAPGEPNFDRPLKEATATGIRVEDLIAKVHKLLILQD